MYSTCYSEVYTIYFLRGDFALGVIVHGNNYLWRVEFPGCFQGKFYTVGFDIIPFLSYKFFLFVLFSLCQRSLACEDVPGELSR